MNIRPIHTDQDYRAALKSVSPLFDNEPQPGTPEGDYFDVMISLGIMLVLNGYLMFQVCRNQVRPRTSRNYLLWCLTWIVIAFYANSAWFAIPMWLGHLFMSIRLRPGALRRGWPKEFYKQGRMPLGDILD